jgi:enhancer of mRNA-decapping protein 4
MVLCSASLDGLVKFWDTASLVEERKNDPLKILHEWYPHDKQPVSCIKFLDNHLISDSEIPFWRFLLTGASQNRQLKIWCTVKWDCLQTITFEPNPTSSIPYNLPAMKLSTDQSGKAEHFSRQKLLTSKQFLFIFSRK